MKVPLNIEDEIYNRYASLHFSRVHNVKELAKEYERFEVYYRYNYIPLMPTNKESQIFDLACGFGHFLYFLKENGYINSVGIDSSKECFNITKAAGLSVINADLFDWLENNEADVIIANDVVEHMSKAEFEKFLFYCHRSLKSGGRLIIKAPNAANPITGCAARYIDYTHKESFTELSLSAALKVYFTNTIILGQNIYVFYRNPLNYIGMIATSATDLIFRLLSILYGQTELKIFKKSLISLSIKS